MTGLMLPERMPERLGDTRRTSLDDLMPYGLTRAYVEALPTVSRVEMLRRRKPSFATRILNALPLLAILCLFTVAAALPGIVAAQVFTLLCMLTVPGALLMNIAGVRPTSGLLRLGYAAASSVVLLMLVGLLASVALPHVGIRQPLSRWPMVTAFDLLALALLLPASGKSDPLQRAFGHWQTGQLRSLGFFALPPLGAAMGSQLLNNGQTSLVAIATALGCCALLVGTMLRSARLPAWWFPATLFSVAVAATWAYAMRSNHLFGFDIQQEFQAFTSTMRPGIWHVPADGNPYQAMLSITALPTVLARVSGVSGIYLFKIIYPVLFSFVPVVVYEVTARWVPRAAAFASAALLIALPQFAGQLPAITRQEIALLLFAVVIAVAFDANISLRTRKCAVLLGAFGLGAAHYSTAYATVGALVIANVLYGAMRLRRNAAHEGVFTLGIVVMFAVIVLGWNVVITNSSQNLSLFLHTASERGADILPNAKDGSLTDRWLTGNTVEPIGGHEFYGRARGYYVDQNKFISFYPTVRQAQFPAVDSKAPEFSRWIPGYEAVASVARIATSQLMLVFTGVGILWFTWRRRRNDAPILLEFATLALSFLSFLVFMRVSGVAAEAYNQERAQLHAAVLLSLGLASTIGWALRKRHRATAIATSLAIAVLFLASSGISGLVGGGDISPTLANRGESYERFFVTTEEGAAAQWLDQHRAHDAVIFTDRYGKLRLWGSSNITEVFDSLVPGTIDRNAYVFASRANVVDGRARGQINQYSSSYKFPLAFLQATKATLYSNSQAQIFR